MSLLKRYRAWQGRQRAVKEARLLLREGRRVLRRTSHRITVEVREQVQRAVDDLAAALEDREHTKLAAALNALDQLLEKHLSFARKSTAREYAESIGVAVLIALLLRAFVVEAFKIPSGSMIPTLQVGDHIFVNKFIYGVRLPFTNVKFGASYRKPKRGEVIVFVYPKDPEKDFIKRVVAVEGDTVEVRGRQLFVNGTPIERTQVDGGCQYEDFIEELGRWEERRCEAWRETIDGDSYTTVYEPSALGHPQAPIKVPPGRVFVMGDNRDNSHDSRFWGFVPFEMIKGKAMVVWWSFGNPEGWRYQRMFQLIH